MKYSSSSLALVRAITVALIQFSVQTNFANANTSGIQQRPKIYLTKTALGLGVKFNEIIDMWVLPQEAISFGVNESISSITLTCNSSQPIDWDFEGKYTNSIKKFTRIRKVSSDIFDEGKSAYVFEITVTIGKYDDGGSGFYICKSLENSTLQDSLFVFSLRQRQRDGIRRKITITSRLDQSYVTVNCIPDETPVIPSLLRDAVPGQNKTNVTCEDFVSYNMTRGFILQTDHKNFEWGNYECVMEYDRPRAQERTDVVLLKPSDVILDPLNIYADVPQNISCASKYPVYIKPFPLQTMNVSYIHKSASFPYKVLAEKPISVLFARCFSNITNSPIAEWKYFKETPSVEVAAVLGEYSEGMLSCISTEIGFTGIQKYACGTPAECNFLKGNFKAQSGRTRNGESTTAQFSFIVENRSLTPLPVHVRCFTENVEDRKIFLLDLDRNFFQLDVTKIHQYPTNKISRLSPSNPEAYEGENVTYTCVTLNFIFAHVHWVLHYRNGSKIHMSALAEIRTVGITQQHTIVIKMSDKNVVQVSCYAPFWNSRLWAISSANILVKEREAPRIAGSRMAEFVQIPAAADEEIRLTCVVTGYPRANLSWQGNFKEGVSSRIETNELDHAKIISVLLLFSTSDERAEENEYKCLATNIFGTTTKTFRTILNESLHPASIVGIVIGCFLLIAAIAFAFWRERKKSKLLQNLLTEKDIKLFLEGSDVKPDNGNMGTSKSSSDHQAQGFPEKYQLPLAAIELDRTKILGAGAYGVVRAGKLIGWPERQHAINYENIGETVAIKTVKPDADVQHVKNLLAEIKTMAFVGTHEYIVNFIGACVQNISKNEIYVVLEFCDNGSLESYIRAHRNDFLDTCLSQELYTNINPGQITTRQLLLWSQHIALALTYLSEKNVIHGDMATRNVLLSKNMIAKVSDFGLAKQLYNYSKFTRTGKELLPWRWMAIESLRDMEFSVQSDVWSFGITLWEMFSLCEIPYPGLGYTLEFVNMIKLGFRLPRPEHAPQQIYDTMIECWHTNPLARPRVETIVAILKVIGKQGGLPAKSTTTATQ